MTVASRVAVMDHGRIVQVDTPDRIYETPNSVYVADFIGDVTIIEGSAAGSGDGYEVAFDESQPPLFAASDLRLAEGQPVHLAIRPEKVAVSAHRPQGVRNALEGKILDIAYLGNLSTYHVELPGGRVVKAQAANTSRLANRPFTWDDRVWLSWDDAAAVLLEG